MLPGLPFALLGLVQATGAAAQQPPVAAAPAATTAPPPVAATKPVPPPNRPDACGPLPNTDSRTIIVCAPRPQGYRIDPDVMEARREHRHPEQIKPRDTMQVNNCATVGPMGCRGQPGIDLVSAAGVLAEMAARAARGENVGQMLVTEPQPDEYQLYVEARKRRQAEEAQAAAAKAKAAALAAKTRAAAAAPTTLSSPPSPSPAGAQ